MYWRPFLHLHSKNVPFYGDRDIFVMDLNVSLLSVIQFGCDIYLKTWARTQPHDAFWTPEFCSCFLVFWQKGQGSPVECGQVQQ